MPEVKQEYTYPSAQWYDGIMVTDLNGKVIGLFANREIMRRANLPLPYIVFGRGRLYTE